ncbi:hypothetical protein EGW08_017927 [Elysia chlorotica]|uniref:SRCR domain-containing protein n=1 Tax=Elysia chlorotica TaxID=188477 RepID=A0A3S1B833_ELYCH|nr:hypothetical protein EGW08_017927 [Elysia chlorotica]
MENVKIYLTLTIYILSVSHAVDTSCTSVLHGGERFQGSCFKALPGSFTDESQAQAASFRIFHSSLIFTLLVVFIVIYYSSEDVLVGLVRAPDVGSLRLMRKDLFRDRPKLPREICFSRSPASSQLMSGVYLDGSRGWKSCGVGSVRRNTSRAICQKVIPVYNYTYVAGIPDSALSVADSALLSASHAHNRSDWITVNVKTSNSEHNAEHITFRGEEGLQYRKLNIKQPGLDRACLHWSDLNIPPPGRCVVAQDWTGSVCTGQVYTSPPPGHRSVAPGPVSHQLQPRAPPGQCQDLSAISSSLVLPLDSARSTPPGALLGYTSPGQVSLCCGAEYSIEGLEYHARYREPTALSANLTNESPSFCVDGITDFGRAPAVNALGPVALFAAERQSRTTKEGGFEDGTFEQVLTTSHLGDDYLTIPSLPVNVSASDTFTVVAARQSLRIRHVHCGRCPSTSPHQTRSLWSLPVNVSASDTFTVVAARQSLRIRHVHCGRCPSTSPHQTRSLWSLPVTPSPHQTRSPSRRCLSTSPHQTRSLWSLPVKVSASDTFTVVAAHDDTVIKQLPYLDSSVGKYEVTLTKAGDSKELRQVPPTGFHCVTGSKPFYLYAVLGAEAETADSLGQCRVTMLARHLWAGQYTVHLVQPWTLLRHVTIIVVGLWRDLDGVRLTSLGGDTSLEPTRCVHSESPYTGCYFVMDVKTESYALSSSTGGRFAAYMYGSRDGAAACHQLGLDTRTYETNTPLNEESSVDLPFKENLFGTNSPSSKASIPVGVTKAWMSPVRGRMPGVEDIVDKTRAVTEDNTSTDADTPSDVEVLQLQPRLPLYTVLRPPLYTVLRLPLYTVLRLPLYTVLRPPLYTVLRPPLYTVLRLPLYTVLRLPLYTVLRPPLYTVLRVPLYTVLKTLSTPLSKQQVWVPSRKSGIPKLVFHIPMWTAKMAATPFRSHRSVVRVGADLT